MVDVARSRGRPKGSGKNDSGPLMMVAGLMVDDPKLMPTTAMRRVLRSTERHRWPETDETLIRRWQVKWKAEGAAYLQKVRDERTAAEAERQRREQADQARQSDRRTAWHLMAEARAAGHVPQYMSDAMREIAKRHTGVATMSEEWRRLAEAHAPVKMSSAVSDMFAEGRLAGLPQASGSFRAAMGILGDPGFQETMRKVDAIGRTMQQIGTILPLPKLPEIPC